MMLGKTASQPGIAVPLAAAAALAPCLPGAAAQRPDSAAAPAAGFVRLWTGADPYAPHQLMGDVFYELFAGWNKDMAVRDHRVAAGRPPAGCTAGCPPSGASACLLPRLRSCP